MTDVAVYGATAAGVMAAVAAAEAGAETVLVDSGAHVGGMVSGGLSWTDVGDANVIGGSRAGSTRPSPTTTASRSGASEGRSRTSRSAC